MISTELNQVILDIILFLIISYSLYTDLRYGKIYNFITLPSIIVGIVLNFLFHFNGHLYGFLTSFGACLGAFIFFIIPYTIGMLGGGDVKLMMAIGSLMGHKFLFYCIIFIGIVSFIFSILTILFNLLLKYKTKGFINILISIYFKTIGINNPEIKSILKMNLKFGVSIFFGTIITYYYLKDLNKLLNVLSLFLNLF